MTNPVKTMGDGASALAHEAALSAEHAIRSTQRVAQQGLDHMAEGLNDARSQTTAAAHHLAHDAKAFAHRGMDAMGEMSHELREKSVHAKDVTTHYIQHDPLKSMLVAAAVGAALMGIVVLVNRGSGPDR